MLADNINRIYTYNFSVNEKSMLLLQSYIVFLQKLLPIFHEIPMLLVASNLSLPICNDDVSQKRRNGKIKFFFKKNEKI